MGSLSGGMMWGGGGEGCLGHMGSLSGGCQGNVWRLSDGVQRLCGEHEEAI